MITCKTENFETIFYSSKQVRSMFPTQLFKKGALRDQLKKNIRQKVQNVLFALINAAGCSGVACTDLVRLLV